MEALTKIIKDTLLTRISEKLKYNMFPLIVIFTGPSGSGKTTLAEYISSKYGFIKPKTYTTRKPRSEENTKSYCFITEEEFLLKISKGEMAEYVRNFGYYYGSSKRSFETENNVALPLDYRGAKSIKELYPGRAFIVHLNISKEMMLNRINKRSKITEEQIQKRLEEYEGQIGCKFDYIIDANSAIENAYNSINSIIDSLIQENLFKKNG